MQRVHGLLTDQYHAPVTQTSSVSVSLIIARLPSIENILETLIYATPPIEPLVQKLREDPIVTADEVIPGLTGQISYVQFAQSMMKNKSVIKSLFEPVQEMRPEMQSLNE